MTGIDDSLNAEIALGTVSSIWEGVVWLGYTYMFVRMKKNPLVYGMNDPHRILFPSHVSQSIQALVTTVGWQTPNFLHSAGTVSLRQPSH
jgi:antiviral helicase SLH1